MDEQTILHLWTELSAEDRDICENYATLLSGRELQHAMTDAEVDTLIKEMNRNDLLRVLTGQKGNGAAVMMEDMVVEEPPEYMHTDFTIKRLFEGLDKDYYGRYAFRDMQNVILEDRRIRLNAWAAKILDIPVQKIPLNKHLNPASTIQERKDPRSLHYTLTRAQPLPMISKKPSITSTPLDFPVSICDKKKLQPNEENLVLGKLLHRHAFKFTPVDQPEAKVSSQTVYILKNLNEGRNGQWNNYAGLAGNGVDSYVKYKSRFDHK